ncbi:hypothetical protein B484DRAFT_87040, partial [Ochromonadaceae sp. CCMP2298]
MLVSILVLLMSCAASEQTLSESVLDASHHFSIKQLQGGHPSLKNGLLQRGAAFMPLTPIEPIAQAAAATGSDGIAYLEFYEGADCGGAISLSSGVRSNLCLPSTDYVKPPFADDDTFYYKYPFQSLRLENLT